MLFKSSSETRLKEMVRRVKGAAVQLSVTSHLVEGRAASPQLPVRHWEGKELSDCPRGLQKACLSKPQMRGTEEQMAERALETSPRRAAKGSSELWP